MGVWAGLAAALLVVFIGAGTLEAAAQADPASPLFPLLRLEQNYQVATAGNSATRADLHLQYARQWMQAMLASAQHGGSAAQFDGALNAMRDEDRAAEDNIAQIPQGDARRAEDSKLASLRLDERTALTTVLAQRISWESRLHATSALGSLGGQTPTIVSATEGGTSDAWVITLLGTGFEPGAALVMDGRPVGQITALTPTRLVALAPRMEEDVRSHDWGILNPDGTAALAPTLSQPYGQPSSTETPGDHGGPSHSGGQQGGDNTSGSGGRGQSPTPTASDQSSPGPVPTESVTGSH